MEEHIRQSNLIEGIDDPLEDKRSLKAWNWLKKQDIITLPAVLHLHYRITHKQLPKTEAGQFRRFQVYVGNHVPPAPQFVGQLMYDWVMDLYHHPEPEDEDPRLMHIRFETIHPFIDGNGRTGRMLMWWHEKKLGKEPTLLKASERQEYYKWFRKDTPGEASATNEIKEQP